MLSQHVRSCAHCALEVQAFRRFMGGDASTEANASEPSTLEDPLADKESEAGLLGLWKERLDGWLDHLFPGTVPQAAYRGGAAAYADHQWERAARLQAERPLLETRQEGLSVILHIARGFVLGHVSDAAGEPCYPMVLKLRGGGNEERVVNQPDGTFQLRWDPDATEIECLRPTGQSTSFRLPD